MERLLDWYNLQLERHPFETNAFSNGAIGAFSDILRQLVEYYLACKGTEKSGGSRVFSLFLLVRMFRGFRKRFELRTVFEQY